MKIEELIRRPGYCEYFDLQSSIVTGKEIRGIAREAARAAFEKASRDLSQAAKLTEEVRLSLWSEHFKTMAEELE